MNGNVRPGEIYRASVSNKAKLIYEEVGDWLEGSGVIPKTVRGVPGLEEQIRLQCEVAQRLKKSRMEQGALDLETIEANAVVEGDVVRDLVIQKKNLARTIIEELMVAANGTTVNYLGKAGIPMIQRVVRTPRYGMRSCVSRHSTAKPFRQTQIQKRSQNFLTTVSKSTWSTFLTCP